MMGNEYWVFNNTRPNLTEGEMGGWLATAQGVGLRLTDLLHPSISPGFIDPHAEGPIYRIVPKFDKLVFSFGTTGTVDYQYQTPGQMPTFGNLRMSGLAGFVLLGYEGQVAFEYPNSTMLYIVYGV